MADDHHDLPPELLTYFKLVQAVFYLGKHGHYQYSAAVADIAADYYNDVCME